MDVARRRFWAAFCRISATSLVLLSVLESAHAVADFRVTTPGGQYFFVINGQTNPAITLVRGKTYTFAVTNSSIHPFQILSTGAANNNTTQGVITYTVPLIASNYIYHCSVHSFMVGSIQTVDPPPPPPAPIRIVGFSLGTNITLVSTGTNTWNVMPEYSTNLALTNWFALTVQTNRYTSGTNETICGRPDTQPIFIRIRSQPK
jgi:hypothetical protein